MQKLAHPQQHATWNTAFIEKLDFIKRKLRFPLQGRSMWKSLVFLGFIPAACILIYALIFLRAGGHLFVYLIILISTGANLLVLRKYYLTLRFRTVQALPTTTDNIGLLSNFLQRNHFAFQQHPDAPEVFQIISRNISAGNEDREVLVFIADNGRILLNSHFTQSGTKPTMGTLHTREMAKDLMQFLRQKTILSS